MTEYTILGPIYPAEKCYLFEVLQWRAFARFPAAHYSIDGNDWRFQSDVREGYEAPIPNGIELSEGECQFAGIPPDPTMQALLQGTAMLSVSKFDEWISDFQETENNPKYLAKLQQDREEAITYERAMEEWTAIFDDYTDPFRAEIYTNLRSGTLRAFGTKLPNFNFDKSLELIDPEMERDPEKEWDPEMDWTTFPATEIPSQIWISNGIKWSDSAIEGREEHYIWVHVLTEDMLSIFPPTQFINRQHVHPVGENFAMSTSELSKSIPTHSKRGRPSLPWEEFHAKVAALFRDSEMPEKKEAGIALLQEWFEKSLGKPVSRSSIGDKLKPYYDRLFKEDRK